MTHIVDVPAFDKLIGADYDKVAHSLVKMGYMPNLQKGITGGTWLLPPQSNTTQYGPVPQGMYGVEYELGQGAYLQILLDQQKTGNPPIQKIRKMAVFVPGQNGVQKAGQIALQLAQSAIISFASAGAGELAGAATTSSTGAVTGGANVADYGLDSLDYSNTFDAFSFSDSEAATAVSDAQNVDFGIEAPSFGSGSLDATQLADPAVDDPSAFTADYGATPEPATGFGTTANDPQFTSDNTLQSGLKQGVSAAVKKATGDIQENARPANQTSPTGQGTNVRQITSPVSGSNSQGTFQQGSAPALASAVGVFGQIESMFSTQSTGQLKPNTGAAATGKTNTTNFYLMVGLALIAAAVLIKGKV